MEDERKAAESSREQKQETKGMLMTEGVIWKQILAFSLPLLVGNLSSSSTTRWTPSWWETM